MTEKFFYGLEKIESTFNGAFCFYLSLIFIFVAFIFSLIISIKHKGDIRKRVWFVFFSLGIIIMQVAENLKVVKEPSFTIFLSGVSVFFTAIIMTIPKRENKITTEQREFIKRIDDKKAKEERLVCKEIKEDSIKENEKSEIQFSHVKSIIERLDNLGLNNSDKKTIHDLKLNISEAESGNKGRETKEKINDGLSALLKIMAKYGA
ncbi:MAG: hypothetical protein MJ066_03640 [Clostridia bacterium]|nr:hypothetical protein [Clostridia bacterium]